MLKIYFDDVLVDSNHYLSLKQSGVIFDDNDSFSLGTTLARQFILIVPKSVFPNGLQEVRIEYLEQPFADLIVDRYDIKEGGGTPTVEITLVDRMVLTNFDYDYSHLVPCTTKDILIDICDKIGVEWGQTEFVNDDVVVDFYDNTISARQYLSFIAELNGGFARIEQDGKLYLRNFSNLNYTTIDPNLCEDIIVGQEHNVERVVYTAGTLQYETSNDTTLETLYLNGENVFITDETVFNNIVPNIIDFKYYNLNTGRTYAMNDVISGDVLGITYNGIQYFTIAQLVDFNFMGIWVGTYNLMLNSRLQEETQNKGLNALVKSIRISVDRINQVVNTQIIKIEDLDTKYTEMKQTLDGIDLSLYYTKTETDDINEELSDRITENARLISINESGIKTLVEDTITDLQGQINTSNERLDTVDSSIQTFTTQITDLEGEMLEQKTHYQVGHDGLFIGSTEWDSSIHINGENINFTSTVGDILAQFGANGMYVNRWLTDLHVIEKFEENGVRGTLFRDRRDTD